MNKGMYKYPVVDMLRERGDEQAQHSMGFHALEVLDKEVAHIADDLGPLRILEIGAYRCYSTILLAQYGRVWSLDICDRPESQSVIDCSEHKDNIVRIVAYDQTTARELVRPLAPFDIVYVDADHSYKGVSTDCKFIEGMADIYFFHDYQDKYEGCRRAIDDFVLRTGGVFNHWGDTSGLCRVVLQ